MAGQTWPSHHAYEGAFPLERPFVSVIAAFLSNPGGQNNRERSAGRGELGVQGGGQIVR